MALIYRVFIPSNCFCYRTQRCYPARCRPPLGYTSLGVRVGHLPDFGLHLNDDTLLFFADIASEFTTFYTVSKHAPKQYLAAFTSSPIPQTAPSTTLVLFFGSGYVRVKQVGGPETQARDQGRRQRSTVEREVGRCAEAYQRGGDG